MGLGLAALWVGLGLLAALSMAAILVATQWCLPVTRGDGILGRCAAGDAARRVGGTGWGSGSLRSAWPVV